MKSIFYRALTVPFLLSLVLLSDLSRAAEAAEDTRTPEEKQAYQRELFKRVDHDKDGKVTEKEFVVAVLYDVFATEDKDGDGKVTKEQALAAATVSKERAEEEYAIMDQEGKGYLVFGDLFRSKTALDDLRKDWKKLDKKGKGHITLEDLPDLTD